MVEHSTSIIPIPRCPMTTRLATPTDLPFIDRLQRTHSHMVGWMPRQQLEGKIAAGHVLVAEEKEGVGVGAGVGARVGERQNPAPTHTPAPNHSLHALGYVIAQDQYFKRDDVGVIYQLNVLPLRQRHLIGATLVKAAFERAAYGCKLFCLWCAQDIQANFFWEALGFVPLAFRTGSREKQRIHIFWQRRIRDGDTTTPYWFPSQTGSGSLREDRLVLPIPPGTHWRDVMPIVLPGTPPMVEPVADVPKTLPGGAPVRPRPQQPKITTAHKIAIIRSQSEHLKGLPPGKAAIVTAGGLRYIDRGDYVPEVEPPKPKRAPKPRAKNDPKLIAAARDLRDRYLEQFNSGLVLPNAKYDVSRQLEAPPTTPPGDAMQTPLLEAA